MLKIKPANKIQMLKSHNFLLASFKGEVNKDVNWTEAKLKE